MRWLKWHLFIVCVSALAANAQSEKIIKVLPHYLDLQGRASLSPSLFDRDAYQAKLRAGSTNCSGLRFDVQWKASYYPALVLRIEAKGAHGREPKLITLDQPLKPSNFSQWTSVSLTGEAYTNFGQLISWRA
ncbi:MAG TPA: hypothetical protein VGF13_23405, partial [Verrucomicrobiae bacterium]